MFYKNRLINTKFWSDSFIVDLPRLDRYLFLYLLTNEHTNICGVYELSWRVMEREVEMTCAELKESFKRLDTKAYYIDGWVWVVNFPKHQRAIGNVLKGIENAMISVPSHILAKINEIKGRLSLLQTDRVYTPKEQEQEQEQKQDPPTPQGVREIPESPTTASMTEEDFKNFWSAYPRRVAVAAAKKSFMKLSRDILGKIMSAVEAQKLSAQWQKENGQFIPYPATWLNQQRWEDDTGAQSLFEIARNMSISAFLKKYGEDVAMTMLYKNAWPDA